MTVAHRVAARSAANRVVIFGGNGFVGSHLAAALARDGGYDLKLPVRDRERVKRDLILLPNTDVVTYNSASASSIARMLAGAGTVINLVGILNEDSRNLFERVHGEFVRMVVEGCLAHKVGRIVQISALGTAAGAPSAYFRSKSKSEKCILSNTGLQHTIIRPSVIFGEGDGFINLFSALLNRLPVVAVPCGDAKMQPIAVEDVVAIIIRVLRDDAMANKTLHIAGADSYTLRDIVEKIAQAQGQSRKIFALGDRVSFGLAAVLEWVPFVNLLTRDNCLSMQTPSTLLRSRNDAFAMLPKLVSLDAGLAAFVRQKKSFGKIRSIAGRASGAS